MAWRRFVVPIMDADDLPQGAGDPMGRPPGLEDADAADLVRYIPRCLEVLGLGPRCTVQQVEDAYRRRAYRAQMNLAGGDGDLQRIQQAFQEALDYVKHAGPLAETNARDDDFDDAPASQAPPRPARPAAPPAAAPQAQGDYQAQPRPQAPPAKKPAAVPSVPRSDGPRGRRPAASLHDDEKLLARFETQLAFRLQPNAEADRRAEYLAGQSGRPVHGTVAVTSRRLLFKAEYLAGSGVLGLGRKRYRRVDGELAMACLRGVQPGGDGIRIAFVAHGPLAQDKPAAGWWVLEVAALPPRILQAIEDAGRVAASAPASPALGRVTITAL